MATTVSSQPTVLNEFFQIDPVAKLKDDLFWKSTWKIAQYAVMTIFIIGAVAAVIGTTLFFPSQVFGVTLAMYTLGLHYTHKFLNYLYAKSDSYDRSALSNGRIVKQLNKINDADVPNLLSSLGVNPPAEISQEKLKIALAQYTVLKEDQAAFLTARKALKDKFPQVKENNTVENLDWSNGEAVSDFKNIQDIRLRRTAHKTSAVWNNVLAAYALKLMQSPYEQRKLDGFCQWNPIDPRYMFASKAHGDASTSVLLKTPRHHYTAKELLQKDSTTLAREIFELPNPLPAPVKSKGWFGG